MKAWIETLKKKVIVYEMSQEECMNEIKGHTEHYT